LPTLDDLKHFRYFSKVCRAVRRQGPEDDQGHFVAVKIIKNASSLAEIQQEVEMISKCQHPNVVQYVGHFMSEMSLIHIVIEYMGGGDLHRFLINAKNVKIKKNQVIMRTVNIQLQFHRCQQSVMLSPTFSKLPMG
jgi:serine/threonine protein kinase